MSSHQYKKVQRTTEQMEQAIREIIGFVGDDPTRGGVLETPSRVLKAWKEWFAGYSQDPEAILKCFEDGAEQDVHKVGSIVLLTNIPVESMCEHHMAPFRGVAHVAYIPKHKIVGISKLDRLVDCFSRRLQVQERLTNQIVDSIDSYLEPIGSACIITAEHTCMSSRGVGHRGVSTTTSAVRGAFRLNDAARTELMSLVAMSK